MTLDWQQTLRWSPSDAQTQRFETLYHDLILANQSLNLTRITSHEEFWEKHLWDSLAGIRPWLPQQNPHNNIDKDDVEDWILSLQDLCPIQRVIDIGTGGGFPGIPVAIACPHWQVSLLDATQKKIQSLSQIVQALKLTTVQTLCDRAEQLGQHPNHRSQYDLALIRAVAAAPVCAEYAIPLLKEKGIAVLYRGRWDKEETLALHRALDQLGGSLCHIQAFTTPQSGSDRHCVYVRKIAPTPEQYPRRVGVPTRKPLG